MTTNRSPPIRYLLDANVFIEAKNRYYGIDFCPAFWDWLVLQNTWKKVASVRAVAVELSRGADDLSAWVTAHDGFFLAWDTTATPYLGRIAEWAQSLGLAAGVVDKFCGGADIQLIAYALGHHYTVVTLEKSAPDGQSNIKIPDACREFDVNCIDTFEMLRQEKANFILGPH